LFGLDPIEADVEGEYSSFAELQYKSECADRTRSDSGNHADQTVAQLRERGEEYQEMKALEEAEVAGQEALAGTVTYEDDDDPFRFREQSELDKTKSFQSRYAWVSKATRTSLLWSDG
jgi:hypothetical protein